jgi:tRNA wybutosine-synthesizing protein 4
MLSHFEKLNTPPKSVRSYPSLQDQRHRFTSRGWTSISLWTLWQAWSDNTFLSAADRAKLDDLEPFDEWEELALFGSHYCLIHARTQGAPGVTESTVAPGECESSAESIKPVYQEVLSQNGLRRFGAATAVDSVVGETIVVNVMGLGTISRLSSCDLYVKSEPYENFTIQGFGPASRMCHTLTDIGSSRAVLIGGRTSPSNPLRDCWIFQKGSNHWERTHELPVALYRHSATRLGTSSLLLVVGGKTSSSELSKSWFLFHPNRGWITCTVSGTSYEAVFGANLVFTGSRSSKIYEGLLAGGISGDGIITDQVLEWTLDLTDLQVSLGSAHLWLVESS